MGRNKIPAINVYTDGGCSPNPGSGGYAALLHSTYQDRYGLVVGGQPTTTSVRMELMAAVRGLEVIKTRANVLVVSDNEMVVRGIMEWMDDWQRKYTLTTRKNGDLWERPLIYLADKDVRQFLK